MKVLEGIGCLYGGGAETQVRMLSSGLARRGNSVKLLYVRESAPSLKMPEGVDCVFLPRSSTKDWKSIFQQIEAIVVNERFDVIHAWLPEVISIPLAYVSTRHKIPLVTSIRRSTFKGIQGVGLVRDALGLLPHVVSDRIVSNFNLDNEPWLVKQLVKWRGSKVISNGIDINCYGDKASIPDRLPGCVRLVFVGRFAVQKRLSFLIQTLAKLPKKSIRLTVFGQGDDLSTAKVNDLVSELKLGSVVDFRGFHPNWRELSGEFDALIMPSVSEGMPNVVLEAMAEHLPVLASDIPEISALLSDGVEGFLFQPDSTDSLLQTIDRFRHSDYGVLRSSARERALMYSEDRMVDAYMDLYRELTLM